ncbi:MAG: ATP-binding protein [Bacteroidota bacterium]
MLFHQFRFNVVVRVLILAGAIFLYMIVWEKDEWPMTRIFFTAGIVGLIVELIRYVERTNRDLEAFLLAIKHKDFTHTFTSGQQGRSFVALKDAFNQIITSYQDLRAEKESHYQYLQNVIEHVSVALICYTDEGQVELMNEAAQQLLDRPYMSNIQILDRVDPSLLQAVKEINTGDSKLVKARVNDDLLNLALQATEFKLQGKHYKLVSFTDIRSELDAKEVDTWQKLIRVLTHEIMNSVTPIISLTKVLSGLMTDEKGQRVEFSTIEADDADDILDSIKTIESRSKGLLHFVHAYRSLTKIQKPQFQKVATEDMAQRVRTLLKPELDKRDIKLSIQMAEPSPHIQADAELIEQVLINLVKNAMEALEGKGGGEITIGAQIQHDKRIHLFVRDNGPGIDLEYLDKVFIPFFTTKKKGSGIGLSLSRQIMRMHKGSIRFHSIPNEGTVFTLVF